MDNNSRRGEIPDRRHEDARLRKVEDAVTYIKAKIDNGLTERTKKNTEQLEKIIEKQNILETTIYTQQASFEYQSKLNTEHIRTTKEGLDTLLSQYNAWNNWIKKTVIGALFLLTSMFGWTIYHSEDISTIINHFDYIMDSKTGATTTYPQSGSVPVGITPPPP